MHQATKTRTHPSAERQIGCSTIGLTLCIAALVTALATEHCRGQGTFRITFDYPVPQPVGTAVLTNHYSEAGMSFTPIPPASPANWFVRQGGGVSFYPENGTTYLQGGAFTTLTFSFDDGSLFNMLSVDLAEYSTVAPVPTNVTFYGYRHDGTVVTETFSLDGTIDGTGPLNDFQTFTFDNTFSALDRVEIHDFGSLDNVIVSIPEPSSPAILFTGVLLLAAWRHKKR